MAGAAFLSAAQSCPWCSFPVCYPFTRVVCVVLGLVTINIHVVKVFMWMYVLISVGYIPRSRVGGSYCNYIGLLEEFARLFTKVPWSVYIPTSNVQKLIFSFFTVTFDPN